MLLSLVIKKFYSLKYKKRVGRQKTLISIFQQSNQMGRKNKIPVCTAVVVKKWVVIKNLFENTGTQKTFPVKFRGFSKKEWLGQDIPDTLAENSFKAIKMPDWTRNLPTSDTLT